MCWKCKQFLVQIQTSNQESDSDVFQFFSRHYEYISVSTQKMLSFLNKPLPDANEADPVQRWTVDGHVVVSGSLCTLIRSHVCRCVQCTESKLLVFTAVCLLYCVKTELSAHSCTSQPVEHVTISDSWVTAKNVWAHRFLSVSDISFGPTQQKKHWSAEAALSCSCTR